MPRAIAAPNASATAVVIGCLAAKELSPASVNVIIPHMLCYLRVPAVSLYRYDRRFTAKIECHDSIEFTSCESHEFRCPDFLYLEQWIKSKWNDWHNWNRKHCQQVYAAE